MRPRVVIVPRGMPLTEAAHIMARSGLPMMLVSDGGRTAGVLTDRALRRALKPESTSAASVGDVMQRRIPHCHDGDTERVLALAGKPRHRRRLFVYNAREQPIGLLDVDDLVNEARHTAPHAADNGAAPASPPD
jgi:CBS domain-containing protein